MLCFHCLDASWLDPFSSQLSGLAPAVSSDSLACAREHVLRASVGRIHAIVRGGAGPVGDRQLRPDPTGHHPAVGRADGGHKVDFDSSLSIRLTEAAHTIVPSGRKLAIMRVGRRLVSGGLGSGGKHGKRSWWV